MGKEAITKELEKRRIPELLRLSDNTPVDTPQLWETRRKEIRDILQKECYGYIPESGWETEWETVSEEENAFGGKPVCALWMCVFVPAGDTFPIPSS